VRAGSPASGGCRGGQGLNFGSSSGALCPPLQRSGQRRFLFSLLHSDKKLHPYAVGISTVPTGAPKLATLMFMYPKKVKSKSEIFESRRSFKCKVFVR
jgi:hypothetical protein